MSTKQWMSNLHRLSQDI